MEVRERVRMLDCGGWLREIGVEIDAPESL
jgi:hypothetical protein